MTAQTYHPFRTSLIDRAALHELNALSPWIPVRDTLIHWAAILCCFAAVALWPSIWVIAGAFVVIGINAYGLYIIGHDGLHRRLFRTPRWNDLWNDVLVVGPFGAITRVNRQNHMTHHHVTCMPEDPDRHKYVHDDKEPVLPFLAFLSGLINLAPSLRHVFTARSADLEVKDAAQAPSEPYTARDICILAGCNGALLGGLTFFVGWWAYPVLWLAPAYTFAYRGDLLRVFCEHSMLTDDHSADASMRLITYESFLPEKLLFAPHNMNFHMAHHLWPSIPYYNLPRADAMIRNSAPARDGDERLIWRRSYFGYLWSYFFWRLRQQTNPMTTATN